jgi:hypothetical protein
MNIYWVLLIQILLNNLLIDNLSIKIFEKIKITCEAYNN